MNSKNLHGQVWIETVLYTLIGLALIGLVLAFATPKINEYRDRALIDQSIDAMQKFHNEIQKVSNSGVGTRTIIPSFTIKKGVLSIDPLTKKVTLTLDKVTALYSEEDLEVPFGDITLVSKKDQKDFTTSISFSVSDNLKIDGSSTEKKEFSGAATPYKFSIEKTWNNQENKILLNIDELANR